jgi:hypothetical protein
MDKFPEAFDRFERDVDIDNIKTYPQLLRSFSYWAGENWKGTNKQLRALGVEAEKTGIKPILPKTYVIHGKRRVVYRSASTGHFTTREGEEYRVLLVKDIPKGYIGMNYYAAKELGIPYPYDKHTVIVKRSVLEEDVAKYRRTAKHEKVEAERMRKGEKYEMAHKQALRAESD